MEGQGANQPAETVDLDGIAELIDIDVETETEELAGEPESEEEQGEELEVNAPDNVRFTRVIKEAVPDEDRAGVVEALWSVVLSDGRRDDDENGFMRLVASLLGVNDRDSAFARQRALKAAS